MSTPAMANFLSLPRIDTSVSTSRDKLRHPIIEIHQDRGSREVPFRKSLPTINTSSSITKLENSQSLLKSATEAVADALGIDASTLPQPFYGMQSIPNDSFQSPETDQSGLVRPLSGLRHVPHESPSSAATSISVYDSPVDASTWRMSMGDSIARRLSMAVAEVLGLDDTTVPRDESFIELGGNHRMARELRATCASVGMSIMTKDIMNCKTIAELETCVTPLSPCQFVDDHITPMIVSPLDLTASEVPPKALNRQKSDRRRPPTIPPKAPARADSQTKVTRKPSRRAQNDVEHILSLNSDISRATVLKPRAGFFEGQLVAFITLASCVIEGPDDCEVKLQNAYYTSQLPAIRKSVEARVSSSLVPSVWIVLERMPVNEDGENNRRKLQTWIQNANDELHRQIISIESEETLVQPTTVTERQLSKAVSKVLQIDPGHVGMNLSFPSLGGDSTTAAQLAMRCHSQGISIDSDTVMQATSLAQLAALATSSRTHSRHTSEATAEAFELSPMQRLYFHTPMGNNTILRATHNGDYRFNQSILLKIKQSMGVEEVRAAVEAMVSNHPMLRCRFRPSGGTWCQFIEPEIAASYHFAHHSVATDAEVEAVITAAQSTIDIESGPVFAAHHLHTHDGCQIIYLVAHHLVVDLKSWKVIADDMEGLLTNGHLVSGRSLSYKEWTLHHRHRVQNLEVADVLPFELPSRNWEYWGVNEASNTYGDTVASGFTLDVEVTSMLETSNQALRTDSSDIFMAALLLSFSQTFRDRPTPALWNQEHERNALETARDVSETVGWFTSLCPLAVTVSPADDIFTILSRVKDSRRAIAERGMPYFTSTLMDPASADSFASSQCPLELIFTYAGEMKNLESQDTLLEQIPVPGRVLASKTSDIGRSVGRMAVFEVSIVVDEGETKFKVLYHPETRHQEQIQIWLRNYERILRQSIYKLQYQSPELSISDVPHMDTTFEGLWQLNKDILPRLNLSVSNIEAIYPVTANQQSILINQSLIPGSSKAQMTYELDTIGCSVDISRICAAWQEICKGHSAMRTVFSPSVSKNGLYDQIILRNHSPSMLFVESDSRESAMVAISNLPPLPLTEGVPWHRLIVCQTPGKTFLKLELSQAICDMASITVLFNELEQAYCDQRSPLISEVSHPEYMQCLKTTPCSIEFWKEKLHGVRPCQFPKLTSKPMEWETTSVDLQIPCENLQGFAKEYRVAMSTVLRVAWGLLLRTYVGKVDVCFGYRISGRDIPVKGLKRAAGAFSTVLACRFASPPEEPIAQLLLDAEAERAAVLHHQHVSMSSVQHALKLKSDPLFNTCLSFGYEDISTSFGAETEFHHTVSKQASEYDINIDVNFHNGKLTVDVGHRIVASEQAMTIAHAFGRAVETILESPGSLANEADLFSMHDHKQILAWNSMPQIDVPDDRVHQLIETKAIRNPEIQAVCAWDGDLTYAELHGFAMVLAKHLLASGLKPQTPLPVVIDKSKWAVVGMLAALIAGAIAIPLDAEARPMYTWVIDAVGAELVLTSDGVRRYVDGRTRKVVVVNEHTITAMSAQDVDMTPPRTYPGDIACILFTHGTDKSPKAISYSHGALATACAGQGATLRMNPSSRVMQLSSYGVDIALSEVLTTLVHGGSVCVPSASERIADFSGAARRMKVNWAYLTPTLSRKLDPESLPDLAIVCFRTRQLDSDAYAPWAGKAKVLLVYGSAESCPLGLSATEVTDTTTAQSFGNPFCGNFWVVSSEDNNRLMPVGALGELVIGGPTLASGFDIKDEDVKAWIGKSAARAKSLLEKSGNRLLKTGHRVRYREQGEIEFVTADGEECEIDGKTFRASDVEPQLRQCLGRGVDVVIETIAFNNAKSAPILAAFIELGENMFHGEEDLTRLNRVTKEKLHLSKMMADTVLRETLPSYMLPSAYIPVKRMPLTPSLKVNRRELQKLISGLSRNQLLGLAQVPNPQEVQAAGLKPLPLTQAEQQMRSIWARVLGIKVDSITASDGFFSLGGDRVTAHQLIVACRRQGISLSIIDILRNQSLTELSRGTTAIETPITASEEHDSPQSSPSNTAAFVDEAIVPQICSEGGVIEEVAEASSLQTMFVESGMLQNRGDVTYFTINISGSLDWQKLKNACFMLTKAHPILRTAFVSHSRQVYQTVLRSYRPEFLRYQCQSWRLSNLATKLIKREQPLPVDFRRPVTKFSYLDAGKSSILVMRLSKAQYDDLSISILVRDLGRFYRHGDQATGSLGFCEVVRTAQAMYASGARDYWSTLLEGASMTQVISQHSLSANTMLRTLSQQIPTGSLQNLGIPFETILKGAWSIVLSNLSGTDDVVFGQLVEGRHLVLPNGQSTSDIVGPMGNIIPVRTRLPDIPITPYEYFRSVQSQHVASIPHESMQASDVIQKCTSWPAWTRFSTVVYHQNQSEEDRLVNFTIGNASCKLDMVANDHQESDVFVKTAMAGSANVDISITFCENKVQASFAEGVLKMLCSTLSLLTSAFVMEPMLLKGLNDTYSTPRIPLPTPKHEITAPSPVQSVDPDQARAVHDIISSAWDAILEANTLNVADIRSVPFYEIWGALMPAAELARYYTEKVPKLPDLEQKVYTTEEMIDHPTMMQQYELIIARQQAHLLKHNRSFMGRTGPMWGKNFRKLTVRTGTPAPSNAVPSSLPVLGQKNNHPTPNKALPSSGESSVDSMTTGSSQSDEDELKEGFLTPFTPPTSATAKKASAGAKGHDGKGHKKGPSFLGKMKPIASS